MLLKIVYLLNLILVFLKLMPVELRDQERLIAL